MCVKSVCDMYGVQPVLYGVMRLELVHFGYCWVPGTDLFDFPFAWRVPNVPTILVARHWPVLVTICMACLEQPTYSSVTRHRPALVTICMACIGQPTYASVTRHRPALFGVRFTVPRVLVPIRACKISVCIISIWSDLLSCGNTVWRVSFQVFIMPSVVTYNPS